MERERSPRFWELARRVVSEAQRHGLVVPGFRTPPRLPGALRTVRRHPGGALVAVAWRDRPPAAVLADLVDGLVLVNGLAGPEAAAWRRRLWAGLQPCAPEPPRAGPPGPTEPLPCRTGPGGGTGQTRGA